MKAVMERPLPIALQYRGEGGTEGSTTDLVHPCAGMATLEVACKNPNDFSASPLLDKGAGQAEHIGIVVLSGQGGQFLCSSRWRPYPLVLVGGHGHPVGRTADQNAQLLTLFHCIGDRVRKVWIVGGVGGVGAIISGLNAHALQERLHLLSSSGTCVVMPQWQSFFIFPPGLPEETGCRFSTVFAHDR